MEYVPFEKYAEKLGGTKTETCGFRGIECQVGSVKVLALESGIGKACAASACAVLIAGFGADIILNAGLSGAVSACRREDIIAGNSYVECDMDLTAIGYAPGSKPGCPIVYEADEALLSICKELGIKDMRLGTGDVFLADKVKKEYFFNTFAINAFDMESAAIACVCHKAGIPFISLRKISDDADDCATDDYREMNDRAEESLTQVLDKVLAKLC